MRKFKTPKKNRTSYIYYSVDGKRIAINPGEDGITEADIETLHNFDDSQIDAENREEYHAPIHLDSYRGASGEEATDRNSYLADPRPNPLESLIQSIEVDEHGSRLKRMWAAIDTLQPQQQALIQKVFFEGRTNVSIAAEENISEAAIRNRLKKIYNNLSKKI